MMTLIYLAFIIVTVYILELVMRKLLCLMYSIGGQLYLDIKAFSQLLNNV